MYKCIKCTVDNMYRSSFKLKKFVNFYNQFHTIASISGFLYVLVNIKKNHRRRPIRAPTLNFTEVIVYDELSLWLKNKKIKNSFFEWSRLKGVNVVFEQFIIVSLLSGSFAQKALSNTFNLVYISPV